MKKGFTLIELLVVIAIIGILSAVVLTSLNSARSKANDAKVKAQLNNVRAAAELWYDSNNGSYANVFTASTSGVVTLLASSTMPTGTTVTTQGTTTAYAVSASLSTSGQFWCVDSTGASKQTSAAVSTTQCP